MMGLSSEATFSQWINQRLRERSIRFMVRMAPIVNFDSFSKVTETRALYTEQVARKGVPTYEGSIRKLLGALWYEMLRRLM